LQGTVSYQSQVTTSQITPSQIIIGQIAGINLQRQIVIGQVATTQIARILKSQEFSNHRTIHSQRIINSQQLDHLAVSYQPAV
jgi:hypothetical protein